MGFDQASDPACETWRRLAHGRCPQGYERPDVCSFNRLPVACDPEGSAAPFDGSWLFRPVELGRNAGSHPSATLREVSRGGWAGCQPQHRRSDQAKGFVVLPKRWVVERTFAWFGRCRRLAKDWECLNRKGLAFLHLASIRLMLRKLCNPA